MLFVVADPVTAAWLASLNPSSRSLSALYRPGTERRRIYAEMVDEILAAVRSGARVCAAFYGHPGVYVWPSHEAVRRARAEGFPARMLPAVSAEDCLVADLGVDPADHGWQSYEATEFLLRRYRHEPTAALVLWQVDAVGKLDWTPAAGPGRLDVLAARLREDYPGEHELVFYRASVHPIAGPQIEQLALDRLAGLEEPPAPTLYVPPLSRRAVDEGMARRLGLRPARPSAP